MRKNLSIYVHIPFCNSKCNYCAFVSKVGTNAEKDAYVKDVIAEIKMRAQEYNQYFAVASIYIGGGTPSCMENYAIRDILTCIYKNFNVKNSAEITIEVNPNAVTKQKIREYILAGVNRFSIGLQCASQKVLAAMGRTHTVEDFNATVAAIRDHGIANISTDLIIGYPGQTLKNVQDSVDHLIKLKIPHISTYILQVEDGTKLKKLVDSNAAYLLSEEQTIAMYTYVSKKLKENGYHKYELSNFALPGFASYHNQVYWDRTDYLGFGVAAHGYMAGVRFNNTNSFVEYHKCITELKKPPVSSAQELSQNEKREEMIMLSLRTSKGLNTKKYEQEFGTSLIASKKDKIANLIKNGYLILDKDGVLKATEKGYLVLNRIVYELV